jgi:hypothetical protein
MNFDVCIHVAFVSEIDLSAYHRLAFLLVLFRILLETISMIQN